MNWPASSSDTAIASGERVTKVSGDMAAAIRQPDSLAPEELR